MSEPEWLKTAREKGLVTKEAVADTAVPPLADDISEKNFMQIVTFFAMRRGWLVYHTHDSRRSQPGMPDLVLVRGEILIFAELKSNTGKLTEDQDKWLNALSWTPAAAVLWRPSMWPEIVDTLY